MCHCRWNRATADDSLKDAFRNAVQQVVGVLVDAETFVKNEEIISDKVLTYSNGFVSTYKEIERPHLDGGNFRTKIKATVETRKLDSQATIRERYCEGC